MKTWGQLFANYIPQVSLNSEQPQFCIGDGSVAVDCDAGQLQVTLSGDVAPSQSYTIHRFNDERKIWGAEDIPQITVLSPFVT